MDGAGRIYVANRNSGTITVYSAGATGGAMPVAFIAGPHTGVGNPWELALH